jgi:hypothetical protein
LRNNTEWEARKILVRGFSPHGAPASAKLSRAEAALCQADLLDMLPTSISSKLRADLPYARNHQVSFTFNVDTDLAREWVAMWNTKMLAKSYVVKGHSVKASVEMSPIRRAQYRTLFTAQEFLVKLGHKEIDMEICHRSMSLFTKPDLILIGGIARLATKWVWDDFGLKTLNVPHGTEPALDAQ